MIGWHHTFSYVNTYLSTSFFKPDLKSGELSSLSQLCTFSVFSLLSFNNLRTSWPQLLPYARTALTSSSGVCTAMVPRSFANSATSVTALLKPWPRSKFRQLSQICCTRNLDTTHEKSSDAQHLQQESPIHHPPSSSSTTKTSSYATPW